jgi:small-conductance mechanosensitive channel
MPPSTLFFVYGGLKSIAVIVWSIAGMRIGTVVLQTVSRHAGRVALIQPRTLPLFEMLIKVLVVGGALYFALLAWNINVTGCLASAGIVGIAVGFAAKDTLANLFAGIFILADAPYKLGDFINLDNGERGKVTDIGIRSTRILTRDDIEITVPNALIAASKIINETGGPHEKERVRVTVFVAYGSEVDQVREILLGCPSGVDHICSEPAPRVRFRELGDSGLKFQLLAWIDEPVLRGQVVDRLNTRVYNQLREAGVEIPYAKQDLYIKEMPDQTRTI